MRLAGIEPALEAWEASVLPLDYSRASLGRRGVVLNVSAVRGFSFLVRDHLQIDDPHRPASGAVDGLAQAVLRVDDAKCEKQRVAAGRTDVIEVPSSHGGRPMHAAYKCFAQSAPGDVPLCLRKVYAGQSVSRGRWTSRRSWSPRWTTTSTWCTTATPRRRRSSIPRSVPPKSSPASPTDTSRSSTL